MTWTGARLQDVPIKSTLTWLSVASAAIGLTQLLLVTHYNRVLGIPDTWFTFGDDLILTVLGQVTHDLSWPCLALPCLA